MKSNEEHGDKSVNEDVHVGNRENININMDMDINNVTPLEKHQHGTTQEPEWRSEEEHGDRVGRDTRDCLENRSASNDVDPINDVSLNSSSTRIAQVQYNLEEKQHLLGDKSEFFGVQVSWM